MKALFYWILVLAVAIGLSVTHAAFAKPNNVDKAVSTQQPDKLRTQSRKNSGAGLHGLFDAAQRTSASGRNGTGIKKSSSCINGTTMHRKH